MQVSFIVTSYNIDAYIHQCLESLCACIAPGDQLIVVDDGSRDDSVARIKAALADLPWPADLVQTPVFLGENTIGGVGIAANIGLGHATGEAVFFVDGDDWLEPAALQAARRAFATSQSDILIANYQTHDGLQSAPPSDAHLWPEDVTNLSAQAAQDLALSLNAVPWRKFYRRAFLQQHDLRFPEGDFFYEDNPFHWAVCLRARSIAYLDVKLAQHRVNRVGQTMADAGHGFAAMFTHYETILRDVEQIAPERVQAVDLWLATNMAWQLERIALDALPGYGLRAQAALGDARAARWEALCQSDLAARPLGHLIAALLRGGAHELTQAWIPWQSLRQLEAQSARLAALEHGVEQLQQAGQAQQALVQDSREYALAARNQAEYLALRGANQE